MGRKQVWFDEYMATQTVRQPAQMMIINGREAGNAPYAAEYLTRRVRSEFTQYHDREPYSTSAVQAMARNGRIEYQSTAAQNWYFLHGEKSLDTVDLTPQLTGKPKGRIRRTYSPDYKRRAIQKRLRSTLYATATEFQVSHTTIVNWEREFRQQAVLQLLQTGSEKEVCEEFGIEPVLLATWVEEHKKRAITKAQQTALMDASESTQMEGASHE